MAEQREETNSQVRGFLFVGAKWNRVYEKRSRPCHSKRFCRQPIGSVMAKHGVQPTVRVGGAGISKRGDQRRLELSIAVGVRPSSVGAVLRATSITAQAALMLRGHRAGQIKLGAGQAMGKGIVAGRRLSRQDKRARDAGPQFDERSLTGSL
jgi:hypothetical protein